MLRKDDLYTIRWNLEQGIRQAINISPMGCYWRETMNLDRFCLRCGPGQVFECGRCKRLMPWCTGYDHDFDFCDSCAEEK